MRMSEYYLQELGFTLDEKFKSKHYNKYNFINQDKAFFIPTDGGSQVQIRLGKTLKTSKANKSTTDFMNKAGFELWHKNRKGIIK